MSQLRALVTVPFRHPDDHVDRFLHEAGIETVYNYWHGHRTEQEMIEILQGIDGIIAGSDPYTGNVLRGADRLKAICREGVGYDRVDVETATSLGIAVCNTPGFNHISVAEYTLGLMLLCARKLMENYFELQRNGWNRKLGRDLKGKTVGIVGLGAIGKEVAKRAKAFGMRVLAYDVWQDEAFAAEHQVTFVSLEQLLRESDYVNLHLNLDAKSRHLMNAERFAMMKPTAYLISVARGAIVDTNALYETLKERRIAGAALDVYEQEPLPADSPLRTLDNAYLFPHIGGSSLDALDEEGMLAAKNLINILRREPPLTILNPEVLKK